MAKEKTLHSKPGFGNESCTLDEEKVCHPPFRKTSVAGCVARRVYIGSEYEPCSTLTTEAAEVSV